MKYLLIQPHSDDVLFSCSHLLFSEIDEVSVLTVENDPKRIKEDEALYNFIGIPFYHLDVDFIDSSYYGFNKSGLALNSDNAYIYLCELLGKDTLIEIENTLLGFIRKWFKENKKGMLVTPLGVGHPFHLFVKDIVEKEVSFFLMYRDFPHSYKKRSAMQMKEVADRYVLESQHPVEEFHDVKWKLASKFYRSQSGLLFYEQSYINKQLPEEIWQNDSLPF